MAKTLYDMLEVAPAASPETIAAAYRSLIGRYHPDKVAALGVDLQTLAVERSKEINLAYETLRDPGRRAAYDRELRSAQAQPAQTAPPPPPRDDDFAPREDWSRTAAEDTVAPPLTRWETTRYVLLDLWFNTRRGAVLFLIGVLLPFVIDLAYKYGYGSWVVDLLHIPAFYCRAVGLLLIFGGACIAFSEIGPKTRWGVLAFRLLLLFGAAINGVNFLNDFVPRLQRREFNLAMLNGVVDAVFFAAFVFVCVMPRAGHRFLRALAGRR